MPRIAGIDIPDNKRTEISLTYIFGIGRSNVSLILKQANVDADKRAKDLTAEELNRLQRAIEQYPIEGALRERIRDNIQRLKRIGSYRGMRHIANLPARGQRTRVNARTRRGKRRTVGAMKKDDLAAKTAAEAKK
jgi:small subunit ribosomal protein S13